MQIVKEFSCMGNKLLFFFLHRKEWIQHVPDLPLFLFFDNLQPIVYQMAP